MSKTITVEQGSLVLEPRITERITQVQRHIAAMQRERAGWGPVAAQQVGDTAMSFVTGLATLLQAEQVWIDGGTGLSFGGVLPGGIVFGMIAREQAQPRFIEGEEPGFANAPIEWTFHS